MTRTDQAMLDYVRSCKLSSSDEFEPIHVERYVLFEVHPIKLRELKTHYLRVPAEYIDLLNKRFAWDIINELPDIQSFLGIEKAGDGPLCVSLGYVMRRRRGY